MANFRADIQMSLTVRTIVPTGAEIIRLQHTLDVGGIRKLLSKGLASPNDSQAGTGRSILLVRESHIKSFPPHHAYISTKGLGNVM